MSLTLHDLNLAALAPEILLMLGICVFLVIEAVTGRTRPMPADRLALATLVLPLGAVLWQYGHGQQYAFGTMYTPTNWRTCSSSAASSAPPASSSTRGAMRPDTASARVTCTCWRSSRCWARW